MSDCNCQNAEAWSAWHDRMPGKTPTLYVTGTCECPTPGYELRLRRHDPQGANDAVLLLDLVEDRPTGEVPEVITPTDVKQYEEETESRYDSVTILPDGPADIPVQEVARGSD